VGRAERCGLSGRGSAVNAPAYVTACNRDRVHFSVSQSAISWHLKSSSGAAVPELPGETDWPGMFNSTIVLFGR
jgi:hypothetical protein